jgi:hypothetical protein
MFGHVMDAHDRVARSDCGKTRCECADQRSLDSIAGQGAKKSLAGRYP